MQYDKDFEFFYYMALWKYDKKKKTYGVWCQPIKVMRTRGYPKAGAEDNQIYIILISLLGTMECDQAVRGVVLVCLGSISSSSNFSFFSSFLLIRAPLPRPRPPDLHRDRPTSDRIDQLTSTETDWPHIKWISHMNYT